MKLPNIESLWWIEQVYQQRVAVVCGKPLLSIIVSRRFAAGEKIPCWVSREELDDNIVLAEDERWSRVFYKVWKKAQVYER